MFLALRHQLNVPRRPTEFAEQIAVRRQSVFEAIQNGRLPVYDKKGKRLRPGETDPRKFLKLDEARTAWRTSRMRLLLGDDETLLSQHIVRERPGRFAKAAACARPGRAHRSPGVRRSACDRRRENRKVQTVLAKFAKSDEQVTFRH
jgi:hypothetical protein